MFKNYKMEKISGSTFKSVNWQLQTYTLPRVCFKRIKLTLHKHFNISGFIAVTYTTIDRLHAVITFNICRFFT